jgi:hypothetical protein
MWKVWLSGLMVLVVSATVQAKVWVEPGTTKVLKEALPDGKPVEAVLEAVGNEWVAFQIVLNAPTAPLHDVNMIATDLSGPDGGVLGAENVVFYLEHYVSIEKPSPCDSYGFSTDCDKYPEFQRNPGEYPDPLIPFIDPYGEDGQPVAVPFKVDKGNLQTVFVDIKVPAGTAPGEFSGAILVSSVGVQIAEIPILLTVWDVTLPADRKVATAYGFSTNAIKDYHGGPDGPAEDDFATLLRNYEWELHAHHIDFTTHNPGLQFSAGPDGNLEPIDFTAYDDYIGPRIDGSYYPDGVGINRYNLGMFKPGGSMMGLTDEQFKQAAGQVFEHLEQKGYLDHVYLYSLDEPWMIEHWTDGSYDKIKATLALLDAATPLYKGHVMVTGPWQQVLDGFVDIWCPVTPMYGDVFWPEGSWPGPDKYKELLSSDRELWFYTCNANFPGVMGYDMDSPLGHEPRLTKWGAWAEGASGFLHWRLTYWVDNDPWNVFANWEQYGDAFSRNGDGLLIYPGDHNGTAGGKGSPPTVAIDGPVVSYRLKQIRDGLEDWELFMLTAEMGGEEYVREQVGQVYRAFGEPLNDSFDISDPPWALDDHAMLEVRRNIAMKAQHLAHPDLYPDPEAQVVEPAPDVIEQIVEAEADLVSVDLVEEIINDIPGTEIEITPAVSGADIATPKRKRSGCSTGNNPASIWSFLLILLWLGVLRVKKRCHSE